MLVNPEVQSIAFTGSVGVGKRILELASHNLTNVVLELGGKDPTIVFRDADVEQAALGTVWAAFMNAGQSCASVERVYVAEEIADAFVRRVLEITNRLRVGDPLDEGVDIGPMENLGQLAVVEGHVREAVDKGAEILCGGGRIKGRPGYFFAPTILAKVDHTMKIMTEETFGPVLPVMTFRDPDQALSLANDSHYGLTASVWTRDRKTAEWAAGRLEAGGVTINDHMISFNEPGAIWGGVKQTGMGRTHGPYGLLEIANVKFVSADYSGKKSRMWWYPYAGPRLEIMEKALAMMHHPRLGGRLAAFLPILKHLPTVNAALPLKSLLRVTGRLFRP